MLSLVLIAASVLLLLAGLAAGSDGLSFAWADEWTLLREIRAPRSIGAWLAGALLGFAGAVAQGLFRNPLADPYLLGSAAGAGSAKAGASGVSRAQRSRPSSTTE
jgi:iron complex transport system permease protein